MIKLQQFESRLGAFIIAAAEEGVCYIGLPGFSLDFVKDWCFRNLNMTRFEFSSDWSGDAKKQLLEYLDGQRHQFTFPAHHVNTVFRKSVLSIVSNIPYGETITYSRIAEKLEKPGSIRAVGTANATNPLPILIPCHRVIRSDGSLGGYGGGLQMKRDLLDMELGLKRPARSQQ